jgi:Aldo/keto reductases, related to diketogulonate reductase
VSLLQLAVIAVGLLIYLANVGIGVPFVFSPTLLLLPVVLSTLALALAVVAVSLLVATKKEDVKTAQSVVPSADSDICDVVKWLEAAVAKGLASYYGLSNVSGRQLEAALTCARRIEPAVVENHYSLMYKRDEIDVLPLVQKLGLLYLAYFPLERGLLS